MKGKVLVALVVAGLGGGCIHTQTRPLAVGQRAQVVADINDKMNELYSSLERLDGAKFVSFYSRSPEFRLFFDGRLFKYDEVVPMTLQEIASLRKYEGRADSIDVSVINPTAAIASAHVDEVLTDSAGVAVHLRGNVSWVWLKEPSGWKIIYGNGAHTVVKPSRSSLKH